MKILITGTAGFIGFHLAQRLIERGDEVVGLDSINDYYDVRLKFSRLACTGIQQDRIEYNKIISSTTYDNYKFIKLNLEDRENITKLFEQEKFDAVCNLAAQAGVRYSIENPYCYIESNIVGFMNILEGCRHNMVKHLVYASSSSVYGLNEKMPLSPHDTVDHPVSLYAATKKSNELIAHSYSHIYGIPTTGLRFFTVYGPYGRPDMALFLFTKAILNDEPIQVFNYGNMVRDFTFIDDIVTGIVKIIDKPAKRNEEWNGMFPDSATSSAPYRIYNIGNSQPIELMEYIEAVESALGKKAVKELMPLQAGDVVKTNSDVSDLVSDFDYKPNTPVAVGVKRFVDWYLKYNK